MIQTIEIQGKECPIGQPLQFEHKYAIRQMMGVKKWERLLRNKQIQLEIREEKESRFLSLKIENDMMFIEG